MNQLNELLGELKRSNDIMTDVAKDIKDMKTFLQVLSNKLSGVF